ncbi:MAG TPA: hypothetical protein VF463_02430 [Sphingobium sp.]
MKLRLSSLAFIAALAATVVAPMAADAHGIWFAQRAKQFALIYGIGSDDLDMVKRFPLIGSVTAYDADYQLIKATPRIAGAIVLIDADAQPTLVAGAQVINTWSTIPTLWKYRTASISCDDDHSTIVSWP